MIMTSKKYTLFETFVGAGGSHIGFKQAGFTTIYANDNEQSCLDTLIFNNPDLEKTTLLDNSSILDIKSDKLFEKLKFKKGEIDVFFGGIVCKGFSLAGERSPNDERSYFYHKQIELVKVFMPKISVIENVPGIRNAKVLSKNTPNEVKNNVDKIWQDIENYKGEKANLRKLNKVTEEVEIIVTNKLKEILEKRKMLNKIKKLEDHYIICGYGRIGTILVKYLKKITNKIVIIENSANLVNKINKDEKIFALEGNAIDVEILELAGIKKAKCLITALSHDADNVFLTLTAKQLNPNLTIMSRANYKTSIPQLTAAGASVVESPYELGAKQMALLFFKPSVRNFYDAIINSENKDDDFALNEIKVSENSPLIDKTIAESKIKKDYDIIIAYIIKEGGKTTFNPHSNTLIKKDDLLVVMGSYISYIKLKSVLQAENVKEVEKKELISENKENLESENQEKK